MPEFSDKQLGKRVVAQSGNTVGEVTDVRDGTLWVTVDEDANPDVVDELRWSGVVNRERERLNQRFIASIREDTIRLRV